MRLIAMLFVALLTCLAACQPNHSQTTACWAELDPLLGKSVYQPGETDTIRVRGTDCEGKRIEMSIDIECLAQPGSPACGPNPEYGPPRDLDDLRRLIAELEANP